MMDRIQLTPEQRASWASSFCRRALTLMRNEKVIRSEDTLLCVAWPRQDRVVILVNPYQVNQQKVLGPKFQHNLRTVMKGHKTIVTNSRGIFFQIGYWPESLDAGSLPAYVVLDLDDVPEGDLMVPLGVTRRGPKWISLLDADSVLIGGTRQMGKTTLIHSWILPLLAKTDPNRLTMLLCDGKNGTEFARYDKLSSCRVAISASDLLAMGGWLLDEINERAKSLQEYGEHGARHIKELPPEDRPPYIVIVIDELAAVLDTEGVEDLLGRIIAIGGAYGLIPILATQRPDNNTVKGFLKCNLGTRISLPVPTHHDSSVILGQPGAEKLDKRKGRILSVWEGEMIEAQACNVPTDMLNDILTTLAGQSPPAEMPSALSDEETKLVLTAIQELNGEFHIRKLAELSGVSRRQVEKIAPKWQRLGLLTAPDQRENLPRRITPRLMSLAGV